MTINILAKILLLILLTACLEDGAVVTVNVDSEQKISEPGRNFEGILTFNNELVANAGDIDENGNTDLAMGLASDGDSGIDTGTILILNIISISYITVYASYYFIKQGILTTPLNNNDHPGAAMKRLLKPSVSTKPCYASLASGFATGASHFSSPV